MENKNIKLNKHFNHHKTDDVVIVTRHDSTTRSVIDPTTISQNINNSISNSIINFDSIQLLPIYKNEQIRGNYENAKVLMTNKKTKESEYYFKGNYDWLLFIFVSLAVIITWVRVSYKKSINQTLESIINIQTTRKLLSEKSNLLQKASLFLTIIYLVSTSVFIFELINYYNIKLLQYEGYKLFIACLVSFLLFFVIKIFLYWLSGILFDNNRQMSDVINNTNIFYRSLGIVTLPFIISIPYVPQPFTKYFLYTVILLFCISFITRTIRCLIISFQNKLSLYYSFLYFCILEILPLLYLYGIFKQ